MYAQLAQRTKFKRGCSQAVLKRLCCIRFSQVTGELQLHNKPFIVCMAKRLQYASPVQDVNQDQNMQLTFFAKWSWSCLQRADHSHIFCSGMR